MKKNILYLNVNSNLGGAERRLLTEVRCIDKERFSVTVGLLYEGPLTEELRKHDIRYVIFRYPRAFLRLSKEHLGISVFFSIPFVFVSLIPLLFRISAYIITNKVQLIISYTFKMHLLSFLFCILNRDIIWQYCDLLPENRILRRIILFLSKRVPKRIIAESKYIKEQFLRYGIGKKVEIVHDGFIPFELQCDEEERGQYRKELGIHHSDFCVGSIGALVEWKGQEYLIKAAKLVRNKIPNLRLFIVGDKIYDTNTVNTKEKLTALIKECNLSDSVIFTGFIIDNKKIFNALDVVVHTSIRPEPFGRVIVEGMFCGKPVIATAAGGALEIINDNATGRLIPSKNPEKIADAVLDLYYNAEKRKELGENGRRYAQAHFDALKQTAALEEFYLGISNFKN